MRSNILSSTALCLVASSMMTGMATASTFLDGVSDIVEETSPSVVYILMETASGQMNTSGSVGTGFFTTNSGEIITNYHVINSANPSSDITIRTYDGEEYLAEIVGSDPELDIAVLDIEGENHKPVEFDNSDTAKVGDAVIAIGSPFGLIGSASLGIISGVNRDIGTEGYASYLQTDAAINMGNSGGPLFNRYGKVIGMNTALFSQNGGNVGIGFAIPSNDVQNTIEKIVDGFDVDGWIGATIEDVPSQVAAAYGLEEGIGVMITEVEAGSPTEASGLMVGDIVLEFDGIELNKYNSLGLLVANSKVGSQKVISYYRAGTVDSIYIDIGESLMVKEVAKVEKNDNSSFSYKAIEEYGLKIGNEFTVEKVGKNSQAYKDGFKEGDLVLKVGITNDLDLMNLETSLLQGQVTLVQIQRDEKKIFIAVR